jgi:hypothetical protein
MAGEEVISISTEVWERKLALYMAATGKNLSQALTEEWPLFMRKVMDFTPPFKTKGAPGASDLSVGRAAVARDIYRTMRPFNPTAKTKQMERILDRKDYAAFDILAMRSHDPRMSKLRAIPFSENEHLRQRDWRGRVMGRERNKVVLGSDAALLKAYVTKVQGHVGVAKAGWLPALLLVGGDAPGYVTKQGLGGGSVVDDRANEEHPSMTAINHTPWAVRQDEGERIKTDAYASRAQALVSKVATHMRLARESAGFKAA